MKYLLTALLLTAIVCQGQTFRPYNTYEEDCGTWVFDRDTSYEGWQVIDTLGDYFQHHGTTSKYWTDYDTAFEWGPQIQHFSESMSNLLYQPCGADPTTYYTTDRIHKLTGIRERVKVWARYKYVEHKKTAFEKLRDRLQEITYKANRLADSITYSKIKDSLLGRLSTFKSSGLQDTIATSSGWGMHVDTSDENGLLFKTGRNKGGVLGLHDTELRTLKLYAGTDSMPDKWHVSDTIQYIIDNNGITISIPGRWPQREDDPYAKNSGAVTRLQIGNTVWRVHRRKNYIWLTRLKPAK